MIFIKLVENNSSIALLLLHSLLRDKNAIFIWLYINNNDYF